MVNNQKNKFCAIITTIVVWLVLLFVCIVVILPRNIGGVLKEDGNATYMLKTEDINAQVHCTVDETGVYTITDGDPQLMFSFDEQSIEGIKLSIASPVENTIPFEIYTAFEDGVFSGERCYSGSIFSGETSSVIDVPAGNYNYLRVDIDEDNLTFDKIEIYETQPKLVSYRVKYSATRISFTIIVSIVLALIVGFFNAKFALSQKAIEWLKQKKIKLAKALLGGIIAAALSFGVELLVGIATNGFNFYRWILFIGVFEICAIFILGYKYLKEKPEVVFLPLVLVLGFMILFGSPIKHICWDFDSHYSWAIHSSYIDNVYMTAADISIERTAPHTLMLEGFKPEEYPSDLSKLIESDSILVSKLENDVSLPHIPAGVFIAIARWFGAGFVVKYNVGRMAYLLIYAFVCYFAIKKIKSGKMILATICLFPTCIYMATNYSYDYWVISFSMLGVAYYTSMLQQPQKTITVWDTIVMCGSFALAALPKLVYIVLMGIPLFMFKKWNDKKERNRYYLILVAVFAVVFALFALKSMSTIGGTGDARGGTVNPQEQLQLILSNPLGYAKTLFDFLKQYLSVRTMQQYISNFAYFGLGKSWIIFVLLICITTLTDSNSNIKFKTPLIIRACAILLFVGLSALIATALYIDFTPVGSSTILGCQPRYIIPLLSPLLLLIAGQRIDILKQKTIYNGSVLLIASVTTMVEMYSTIISKLI